MKNVKTIGGVLLSAASLVSVDAAVAQVESEELTEFVFVEGQRRAYQGNFDDLENPSSVQVLNLEFLQQAGALDLNQALDLSASVARQNNFGGLWNSFSVRGFSGDINLPSGFLVNGFNAGRGFGGPRDLVGIESVEVLKGPRSALFGRGEPGGTVNLVTKRPEFETSGEVRGTVGRWDQVRLEGDVQSEIGSNVGFRLVGFYEDAESFRETVETERHGFYPSITLKPTEDTNVTYELEYTNQEIPFDRGVAFTEEFGFTPRETFIGEPGDGPIETEVLGHQVEFQHNFNESWSVLAGLGYRETDFSGNASEPNFGSRQTLSIDGETLSRFFRFRDFDSEYSVVRAELAGEFDTGALRHRVLVGADYDRFEYDTFILRFRGCSGGRNAADINSLDAENCLLLNVANPVYGQYPLPEPGPNTNRTEELVGFGFYIQDQIDITDQLQVRIGGRFDDFEQDLTNIPSDTVTSSDTRFSPQVGAVYLVNDGLSVYASYGEGFRQNTGSDFEGNQFDPNITESIDIGVKADLSHYFSDVSGSVTLTAFQVDQSNILVNDSRPEATAAGFFSFPAGEAQSRGIELDADIQFEGDITLYLSYAYTDAEFTNSNPDADFGALIEDGDQLINSPENQLNLQLSKGFEIGGVSSKVGGGVLYTDERAGFTGFDFTLPSYTIGRLFAEVNPTDNVNLRLDVDNITDETYYTNSYADVWVQPGTPRSYRFTASYSF